MGFIKPQHQVVCRDCRSLNQSTRSWMARSRPGIKRRPGARATTTGRNRS